MLYIYFILMIIPLGYDLYKMFYPKSFDEAEKSLKKTIEQSMDSKGSEFTITYQASFLYLAGLLYFIWLFIGMFITNQLFLYLLILALSFITKGPRPEKLDSILSIIIMLMIFYYEMIAQINTASFIWNLIF